MIVIHPASEIQAAINIIAENSFHYWLMDPNKGMECMEAAIDNFIYSGITGKIREYISDAVNVCALFIANVIDIDKLYLLLAQTVIKDKPIDKERLRDQLTQITLDNLLC